MGSTNRRATTVTNALTTTPEAPVCYGQEIHQMDQLVVQLHPEGLHVEEEFPQAIGSGAIFALKFCCRRQGYNL